MSENEPAKRYLNNYAIPNSPIWKKVPAYIERERHFINFFIEENLKEELITRLSAALIDIDLLMHEILVMVSDNDNIRQKAMYTSLYNDANKFKIDLRNISDEQSIKIDSKAQNEIYVLKTDLNLALDKGQPYLKNKLSETAIKIRNEVNDVKRDTTFKEMFKKTDDYYTVIKLLKENEFISTSNGEKMFTPPSRGNDATSHKFLSSLIPVLDYKNYLKNHGYNNKETAQALSNEFPKIEGSQNIGITAASYGKHIKSEVWRTLISDFHFIPRKP